MGYEGENNFNSLTSWGVQSAFPCPQGRLQDTAINKHLKKRDDRLLWGFVNKRVLIFCSLAPQALVPL